jgi:hypothetical protein
MMVDSMLAKSKKIYARLPLAIRKRTDGLAYKAYRNWTEQVENISTPPPVEERHSSSSPWIPYYKLTARHDGPNLTILLPSLRTGSFSAGPMIALQIAAKIASSGFQVRVMAIDGAHEKYDVPKDEISKLCKDTLEFQDLPTSLEFEVLDKELSVSKNEKFMATAWWTFEIAKEAASFISPEGIPLYLIQDFEPLLHSSSDEMVLARNTYDQKMVPIVASQILAEYFIENNIGIVAKKLSEKNESFIIPLPLLKISAPEQIEELPSKLNNMIVKPKTLLFYARPTKAQRNLFHIGIKAIRLAIEWKILDPELWNFIAVGENINQVELSENIFLNSAPWLSYSEYISLIRKSDMYIALMNSPHTSFPVIEAMQLSVPSITTIFANKSKIRLAAYSKYIYASEADSVAIAKNIGIALAENTEENGGVTVLKDFQDMNVSLEMLNRWIKQHLITEQPKLNFSKEFACKCLQTEESTKKIEAPTIDVAISVYNIKIEYLIELLQSLKIGLEYFSTGINILILDHGSTIYSTDELKNLIYNFLPKCHYVQTSSNNGIAAGMDILLSVAKSEFFLPIDADDLVSQDIFAVLSSHIQANPEIDFWYSSEYLLSKENIFPATRMDFDEVLLSEMCFTTHAICFNTKIAKNLKVYENAPNGSHDWFTAVCFNQNNSKFQYLNHVLYTWRLHPESTSENWLSKPYVLESQKQVLQKFVSNSKSHFDIVGHPNFYGGPNRQIKIAKIEKNFTKLKFENIKSHSLVKYFLNNHQDEKNDFKNNSVYWFADTPTIQDALIQAEMETILELWPNSVVTSSSKLANEYEFLPINNNTSFSGMNSAHESISLLCRQGTQVINPFNFAIKGETLNKIGATPEQSLEELISLIIANKLKLIYSPNFQVDSQLQELSEIHLVSDIARNLAGNTEIFLNQRKENVEEIVLTDTPMSEAVKNFGGINLITTVKSTSNLDYILSLYENLKAILCDEIRWTLVVHGKNYDNRILRTLANDTNVQLIAVNSELQLNEAIKIALDHSNLEWIFPIDYDDLLLYPFVEGFINEVRKGNADIYVANEVVGKKLGESKYFKRNPPNRLGISLFSIFFHPIIIRTQQARQLVNNSTNFIFDWQLLTSIADNQIISFFDCPVYFWREHEASQTNNSVGSELSKIAVHGELELRRLDNANYKNHEIIFKNGDHQLSQIGSFFPKCCFQIQSIGNELEDASTIHEFKRKYPFSHVVRVPPTLYQFLKCDCDAEFVFTTPSRSRPMKEFDINKLFSFSLVANHPIVGQLINDETGKSSIRILNQYGIYRNKYVQPQIGNHDFNAFYHFPTMLIQDGSPVLGKNGSNIFGRLGTYSENLNCEKK